MAILFLRLLLLLLLLLDRSRGNGGFSIQESSPLLCDPAMWKAGKDLARAAQLAESWCGAAAVDAVRQAMAARSELATSNAVRDSCRDGLQSCLDDRSGQRRECDQEKMELESGFAAAREKSLAEVAYWKQMCETRVSSFQCELEKAAAAATSNCEEEDFDRRSLAEVAGSSSRDLHVEYLDEALASCRLQKAYANATVDDLVRRLNERVYHLYVILVGTTGAFIISLIVLSLYFQAGGPKGGKAGAQAYLTKRKIEIRTPAQTAKLLKSMREGASGCTKSIVTSLRSDQGEEFFILIPVNCFRSRMFALFGCGGDFSGDVDLARDYAAGQSLSIVLYNHTGHAFTESELENLGMLPEDIASKVAPRDCDYPTGSNIGVLWMDNSSEVLLTNADGQSILTSDLTQQDWITLLCRV